MGKKSKKKVYSKVKKRCISFIMALIMIMTIVPSMSYKKTMQVEAASYNAEAALKYASEHWNDNVGLCAEFVSRCVQAGGLQIRTEGITTNCYNAVSRITGVQGQVLKLNAEGYATKSLDGDILTAGDVVIQWCNTHTYRPHILFCGGYDSSGYATFYAHNSALNNRRYRLNVNRSCSKANGSPCYDMGARVLHISNCLLYTSPSPRD